MDWLDLLAVQGTLKSSLTPQFKSINSLVLSFLYGPTLTFIQTIALTRWTFFGKVMSLLFNMLSRFVNFSSKDQASFHFMVAVTVCSDFEAPKIKSATVATVPPHLFAMK